MTDNVLDVYRSLPMDVKVTLLERPHGAVPKELVPRLSRLSGTSLAGPAIWLSNPPGSDPGGFTLHGELPDRLEVIRALLDHWWSTLDAEVRDHLVENRNGELDGQYKDAVMCVGDGKPGGLIVAVVQDNKTGRFRLPAIVDVYAEMKARETTTEM
ncbi:hypothetical protein [Mycobacterium sp. shizuoka-1]|uniref:hypothetical protein n=1 Tax=Mycobacterium sp. shizuoka-1 TaxID=2039281 RepID=UPI000C063018|nr:hypothetical protein [Mycobacterium sp. shizuoka-1]GAY14187.1 hypothetical protein MSZK_09130 [Mycobacterium sp. shizuoka-1]